MKIYHKLKQKSIFFIFLHINNNSFSINNPQYDVQENMIINPKRKAYIINKLEEEKSNLIEEIGLKVVLKKAHFPLMGYYSYVGMQITQLALILHTLYTNWNFDIKKLDGNKKDKYLDNYLTLIEQHKLQIAYNKTLGKNETSMPDLKSAENTMMNNIQIKYIRDMASPNTSIIEMIEIWQLEEIFMLLSQIYTSVLKKNEILYDIYFSSYKNIMSIIKEVFFSAKVLFFIIEMYLIYNKTLEVFPINNHSSLYIYNTFKDVTDTSSNGLLHIVNFLIIKQIFMIKDMKQFEKRFNITQDGSVRFMRKALILNKCREFGILIFVHSCESLAEYWQKSLISNHKSTISIMKQSIREGQQIEIKSLDTML